MSDFRYAAHGVPPYGPFNNWHLPYEDLKYKIEHEPWSLYIPPYRCAPHIWNVAGFVDTCSYLLDTGEGLILIEAPCFNSLYLEFESIRQIGYDPHDIKWIFLTHDHGDHYGSARAIKEYTGAKIYLSRADREEYEQQRDSGTLRESPYGHHTFEVDACYDDTNPLTIGRFTFNFSFCPYHSPASTVFRFEDTDDETGVTYKIALHGGLGVYTEDMLKQKGYPVEWKQKFIDFATDAATWDVDITLASHENQTNFHSGANFENPSDYSGFVDKTVWGKLMNSKKRDVILDRQGIDPKTGKTIVYERDGKW